MPATDEPGRPSMPPQEAEDQPPPNENIGARSHMIQVHLNDASTSLSPAHFDGLRSLCDRVLGQLPNTGSVRVRLVDDAEMIKAHTRFCNLSTTTDVLTFDLAEGDLAFKTKALDTDLMICVDEASRRAAERGHPITHELVLYVLHGVLHCLGHDDQDEDAYTRMHAREDELLSAAGIGRVFGAPVVKESES
jgi:probable rRNA maturation factor